jgi:hypothetical protein
VALVVEDGTGLSTAESYVSVADCSTYCTARGLTFATGTDANKEAALRRATAYIDGAYGARFIGARRNGRSQALQWPRIDAYDSSVEEYVDHESVPVEVINATCEAAVRELAVPGALAPDLERGGQIKSLKAGSVGIEYMGSAPADTTFKVIDQALASLLATGSGSFVGRSVRG